jgi:hypothetical protein
MLDYLNEAFEISNQLLAQGHKQEAEEVNLVVSSASTGTEIVMGLRKVFSMLLRSGIPIDDLTKARISKAIDGLDELLR